MIRTDTAVLAILTSLAATQSQAEEASAVGRYGKSGSYQLLAVVRPGRSPDKFIGNFSVGIRGCAGEIENAAGVTAGPQVIVFTKRDPADDNTCRITLRFGSGYGTVAMSEVDCSFWHGLSCEFSGNLKRVGR